MGCFLACSDAVVLLARRRLDMKNQYAKMSTYNLKRIASYASTGGEPSRLEWPR